MYPFFKKIKKKIDSLQNNPTSIHQQFLVSFIIISSFVALGKLAGFAKEVALAWRYGVGVTVDAYTFIFNLVNWPVTVWYGILTISYIPLVSNNKLLNKEDLRNFQKELLGVTIILASVVGVILFYKLPDIIFSNWLALSSNLINSALELSRVISLLLPLGIVISLYSTFMLAQGRQIVTLLESIPALVLFIFIALSPSGTSDNLLSVGSAVGFVMHLIVLIAYQKISKTLLAPSFSLKSSLWPHFIKSFGMVAFAQALLSFTGIIDQIIASHIAAGSVATLNYANRVLILVTMLGSLAINRGTLPLFSKIHLENDGPRKLFETATTWLKWITAISLLIAILIGWASHLIIKVVYERGAFNSSNTQEVAELFCYGLTQLPFSFGQLLFATALYSLKRYKEMAVIIMVMTAIKIVASLGLNSLIGAKGILLATSVMLFCGLLMCFFVLKQTAKRNI